MHHASEHKLSALGSSLAHRHGHRRGPGTASAASTSPSSSSRSYSDSDVLSGTSGSYSYYSSGSDSYRPGSSSYGTTSETTTSSADSVATTGSTGAPSDVLTPSSAYVRAARKPDSNTNTNTVTVTPSTSSPVSSCDPQRDASHTTRDGAGAKGADARTSVTALATATSTTVNGITVDDADALVQPPRSPSLASSPSSVLVSPPSMDAGAPMSRVLALRPSFVGIGGGSGSGGDEATGTGGQLCPVSPFHFSEEELLRSQRSLLSIADGAPHAMEGGHGAAEGGFQHVLDVVDTIHTVPIAVPPSPEEAQRRRDGGSMPFPTHLTFRIVHRPPATVHDQQLQQQEQQEQEERDGEVRAGERDARKALKTKLTDCIGFLRRRRDKAREAAAERAAARQQSHRDALRSHHVPLVNFRTTRERPPPHEGSGSGVEGGAAPLNVLPTVEEAAGYRILEDEVMGTESRPKVLRRAMRQQHRPASGLRLKTFYAFGRRAGGGPRGAGQSAFLHDGDPQRFWVAHLHESARVHLEPIETE